MAYFCTPDLEILDVVAGPVTPAVFLEHARWAADLSARLEQTDEEDRADLARRAQEERPNRLSMWSGEGLKEHTRLTMLRENPLFSIESATELWFEALTLEKASQEEVKVENHRNRLNRAISRSQLVPDPQLPSED